MLGPDFAAPALPVELVHHICTLALASSPSLRLHRPTAAHSARYALLGPLSRVSHTWHAAALPLLYRHVALDTAAQLDALVDSLSATDGAQHVRTLRIDGAALQGWECILSMCPRLDTLVVAGSDEAAIPPLPGGITRLTYLRSSPLDPLAFSSLHLTHLTLTLPASAALLSTLSATSAFAQEGATPAAAAAAAILALLRPVRFLLLTGDWPPGPRPALPPLAAPPLLPLLLPSLVALGASIPALPLVRLLHPHAAARIAWHVPWQPFVDFLSPWRAFPSSPREGGIETLVLEPLGFDPPGHFWSEVSARVGRDPTLRGVRRVYLGREWGGLVRQSVGEEGEGEVWRASGEGEGGGRERVEVRFFEDDDGEGEDERLPSDFRAWCVAQTSALGEAEVEARTDQQT